MKTRIEKIAATMLALVLALACTSGRFVLRQFLSPLSSFGVKWEERPTAVRFRSLTTFHCVASFTPNAADPLVLRLPVIFSSA